MVKKMQVILVIEKEKKDFENKLNEKLEQLYNDGYRIKDIEYQIIFLKPLEYSLGVNDDPKLKGNDVEGHIHQVNYSALISYLEVNNSK